jgi:hypothetical protein
MPVESGNSAILKNSRFQCRYKTGILRWKEGSFEKVNSAFDRARRVVLGPSLERLEHVLRRIRGGITNENPRLEGIRGIFGAIIRHFVNVMVPLDRARRVVLGTSLERLEYVLRRIRGGITSLGI